MNEAISATLSRTILTSATTVLSLIALYVLGGAGLRDFSLAILVGLMRTLHLDGSSLGLDDLAPILAGEPIQLAVRESCLDGVRASRRMVDQRVARGEVVYGLTTGFGRLKSVAIPREDGRRFAQGGGHQYLRSIGW